MEIILIAIGLAMDAFAVSVASGSLVKKMSLLNSLKMAFFFGFFQAVMPLLGWLGGVAFSDSIKAYDHWIAFTLLLVVGVKMINESFDEETETFNPLDLKVLLTLSVATSIDALAVGVTFSLLETDILFSALKIGVITFVLSFYGTKIGDRFGEKLGAKAEVFGGVILILIGLKILGEHLSA